MATPVKWGHEFLVNTTTIGDQSYPCIAGLADGRFLVTWTDASQSAGDTSGMAVRAQVYNAAGSESGTEFLVNSRTARDQFNPSAAALSDGRFVISWTDTSFTAGTANQWNIRAQVYDPDGSKSGGAFLVNTTTDRGRADSSIATLSDGRFVVVWDGSLTGIDPSGVATMGKIYNSDGTVFADEFMVNTTTFGDQWRPKVTALAAGGFVVTWQDTSQLGGDNSGFSVRARLFDANGVAAKADFLVNTHTNGWQADPNITALTDGRFVVTWQDYQPKPDDPSGLAARAQVFNADGTKSGGEFLANTTTTGGQSGPCVAALPDSRFVIAWVDSGGTGGDSSGYAVKAQLFNANGSKSGAEFLINSTTAGNQYLHSITALADGRFVLAWADEGRSAPDSSGFAIRGQIFDPREAAVDLHGTTLGDDFIGTAFADRMQGNAGDDRLVGKAGDDILTGDSGRDLLFGRLGADTISGGAGDDTMTGGFGNDSFVFAKGGGHDVITDFADGRDLIDLTAFGFARFAGAAPHFASSDTGVVFNFHGHSLQIDGMTLGQITGADLIL